MQTIKARIAALEQATPQVEEVTIFRSYVTPGHLDDEIYLLTADDGHSWKRQPGETQEEFFDRASKEVARSPWGVACLSGNCEAAPS